MDDMAEEAFMQICARTATEYNRTHLLAHAQWKCSDCSKMLTWDAYFGRCEDKDWYTEFETWICRPGAMRTCRRCNPHADHGETHTCFLCKKLLPREAFPPSMWKHRNDDKQKAYAAERLPHEAWAEGQSTPLCSACDWKWRQCHFCTGLHWCRPPMWQ